MKRLSYWFGPLALVLASGGLAASAGAEADRLDWSAWEHLPVFESGRMKPLDTFARSAADTICGTTAPRLSLAGADAGGADTAELDAAKALFADGQPHRFSPGELLWSWLVEPEKWECVPFLRAKNPQLREDLLSLPLKDARGTKLVYVSPRQVEASARFQMFLGEIAQRQEASEKAGQRFHPVGLDKAATELYEAYNLYRQITFNPAAEVNRQSRFFSQLLRASELWGPLEEELGRMAQKGLVGEAGPAIQRAGDSFGKVVEVLRGGEATAATIEPPLESCRTAVGEISAHFAEATRKMFEHPPAQETDSLQSARASLHAVASQTAEVARLLSEAQWGLYDNGDTLRLVPALNPAALEAQRDVKNDAQPWLSVQMLLHGSNRVLAGFPQDRLRALRDDFAATATAYTQRSAPGRAIHFNDAMPRFAAAVRALGESVEPLRAKLPLQERDAALLAATAYPPTGDARLAAEVHYNQFDPFFWGFVGGVVACVALGMAFGWFRMPLFWTGLTAMVGAQAMLLYGFVLRMFITGWAPVTNMFETVIFVALVVALLGLWFVLLPLLWPGLRSAWRMTAMPLTWEASPVETDPARLLSARAAGVGNWLLLAPRIALAAGVVYLFTQQSYGQGEGYRVISLLPKGDAGTAALTVNDIITWLVGLAVLVPSAWYLPRVVLAGILAWGTVPWNLHRTGLGGPIGEVRARKSVAVAGALVGAFASVLAYFAPIFDKDIGTLMPVLRDNFWLTIHVLTITASYGAGLLAWGLGLISLGLYLFGRYQAPSSGATGEAGRRQPPPACGALAVFTYKAIQVAVLLLAAGTIFGALWADVAWGRFWGWDPKEVWALVALLTYMVLLHAQYVGWAGNFAMACGAVAGATMILMAWYGVNYLLPGGLHSYGTGAGGQWPVTIFVVLNWGFMLLAAIRYRGEMLAVQSPKA